MRTTADSCPTCSRPSKMRCRCMVGERRCAAGHRWAHCGVHGRSVPLMSGVNLHARNVGPGTCLCRFAPVPMQGSTQGSTQGSAARFPRSIYRRRRLPPKVWGRGWGAPWWAPPAWDEPDFTILDEPDSDEPNDWDVLGQRYGI